MSGDPRNPDALEDAPQPIAGYHDVAGTRLYAEVRGSGRAVLLIGAADEDAEIHAGIADRLAEFTVVTYDRRGTRRSGREDWPGGGSVRHADDAAVLLRTLGLGDVTVFGASAGGIVALRLALRHPELVERCLCFEPGFLHLVPEGAEMAERGRRAVDEFLVSYPGQWKEAAAVLGRTIVSSLDQETRGLFTPPPGAEWYALRGDENAEALIRGDMELVFENVDEAAVAGSEVDIRFSYGSASLPLFRAIATRLAAMRGADADVLDGVGHLSFYHPDEVAGYIRGHMG